MTGMEFWYLRIYAPDFLNIFKMYFGMSKVRVYVLRFYMLTKVFESLPPGHSRRKKQTSRQFWNFQFQSEHIDP